MIAEDISLTKKMYEAVSQSDELEALTCNLSIATFRYVPRDLRGLIGQAETDEYLDKLNEELLVAVKEGGELFVSNAIIDGRFTLRACIVNFRTSLEDVLEVPSLVVSKGREVDKVLRRKVTR